MDPDFGIRTWYLKPTFFLKIIWGLLSIAALIYLIVLLWMDMDPFFPKACGTNQFSLALFLFLFIVLSSIGNVFYIFKNFGFLQKIKRYLTKILYVAAVTTGISMILAISYAGAFGTQKHEEDAHTKIMLYYFSHPTSDEAKWLSKHLDNGSVTAFRDYADHRCTGAGEVILGMIIPWFILQCVLLFIFLKEDEYEEFGNTTPLAPNSGDTYN